MQKNYTKILRDDAVTVLHSVNQQIWKTEQWTQECKMSVFISTSKKGNAKECLNNLTVVLILHTNKVMLKIFQVRLQKYMNHVIPDVQAGYRRSRGARDQISNIHWIMKKAREKQKNIYISSTDYAKAFDYGSQQIVENSQRNACTRPPYLSSE